MEILLQEISLIIKFMDGDVIDLKMDLNMKVTLKTLKCMVLEDLYGVMVRKI